MTGVVPDVPADVTVGELYRLLIRLEKAVSDLSGRLEGKMVTIDVYSIAQANMKDELAEVKESVSQHLVEHQLDARERKQIRVVLAAAVMASGISLLIGVGGIITSLVH